MNLAQISYDVRTDEVCKPQGQFLPGFDEELILGIERIMVRHFLCLMELILIVQGLWLKSPVLLEIERA
jgi:hypothetical protein